MSAINPPWACQGRTDHPAQLVRMAQAGLGGAPFAAGGTSPLGGVDPYFGAACLVSGLASMNVQIGTGLVFIPNTTAWNGMYAGYNTANFNVSLAAASSTQWRTDRVDAVVTDPGDNTANWNAVVTTGTFSSSSPGATPAAPANSIPLALIRVVPNMTVTNGGGTVVDNRTINGLKGVWPTTSAARPSLSAPNGTMWYEADTQSLGIIVGGAYRYINVAAPAVQDPWHNFNPLVTGFAVPVNGYAKYRKTFDNEVQIEGAITTTVGTSGTFTTITQSPLPAGYRPVNDHIFPVTCDVVANSPANQSPKGKMMTTGHIQIQSVSSTASLIWWEVRCPLDI